MYFLNHNPWSLIVLKMAYIKALKPDLLISLFPTIETAKAMIVSRPTFSA